MSLNNVNAGKRIMSLEVVCLREGRLYPDKFVRSLSTITAPFTPFSENLISLALYSAVDIAPRFLSVSKPPL
ncbi:hypothetical protein MASR1M104_07050 [Cloacibacterium normanense]